jgi:hypothetical protein
MEHNCKTRDVYTIYKSVTDQNRQCWMEVGKRLAKIQVQDRLEIFCNTCEKPTYESLMNNKCREAAVFQNMMTQIKNRCEKYW